MASARRFIMPWWSPRMDGEAAGAPETSIELPGEITHGLIVRTPFGGPDAQLAIHAIRETGVITLAIADSLAFDVAPVPRPNDNRQSGANRAPRTQADGHADDGD